MVFYSEKQFIFSDAPQLPALRAVVTALEEVLLTPSSQYMTLAVEIISLVILQNYPTCSTVS